MERAGLNVKNLELNKQTGDVSFRSPNYTKYAKEVKYSLKVVTTNLSREIGKSICLRVAIPDQESYFEIKSKKIN
ncbi:MAG: hypothetical protein ABEI53_00915 [Candidatus Magasanikbacteria bacterium]